MTTHGKVFRKLGFWTIGAIYFLILVGGIVRATGSGMGCPDWPRCFGSWVPPTDISQLPSNYKEIYGEKLKGEIEFNAVKTWIEYVNRLIGVLIGILVFGTFVSSFVSFRKKDKTIVLLSLLATILVAFEGWLGSKVVSSELHPVMITLHMILSVIIVMILLYAVARSYNYVVKIEDIADKSSLSFLVSAAIFLTTGQVLLGTQVREVVDKVAASMGEAMRTEWVANLGGKFQMHALFSMVIVLINLVIYYKIKKSISEKGILTRFTNWLVIVVGIELVSGLTLAYLGFPNFMQPVHLTLGVLAIGIQFVIFLFLNKERVFRSIAS
ncbi:cytochrome oxidase assembly [Emticicia oligotrophica DSM 17448]|uniref:Cytochrome oxidase assembly n=1 Tax=Emticicia oligotrophica (strain DSM 17448 / CIP 109782 / MTCC 6937 / GPTSA100-15) TaxID=929562 RepID=A0ABM5N090_EMTOG|nr:MULTISPECIES: COX15/CtaA family protein [Emticicia]AFK02875.1 cytochrome oxidase assembly [Emticicia oligotrophica DSM 17448]